MKLDVVSLFAIVVFTLSWICYARTPKEEVLVRLFFRFMLGMGALIGVFGFILRQVQ